MIIQWKLKFKKISLLNYIANQTIRVWYILFPPTLPPFKLSPSLCHIESVSVTHSLGLSRTVIFFPRQSMSVTDSGFRSQKVFVCDSLVLSQIFCVSIIDNLHVQGSKFGGKFYKFVRKPFKKLNSVDFMEFVFSKSAFRVL